MLRIPAPLSIGALAACLTVACGRSGLHDLDALSDTASSGGLSTGSSGTGMGGAGGSGSSSSSGAGGSSNGSSGVGGSSNGSSGVGGSSNGSSGVGGSSSGAGGSSSGAGGASTTSSTGGAGGAGGAGGSSSGAGGSSSGAGGSSSGAGGSSTTSSTSGAGGAGGAGGSEDCTNGVDDDFDGMIDCQDPDCDAGYECSPPVPVGWQGPVALWEGPGNAAPPGCGSAGGFPAQEADGQDGLIASGAVCSGCGCSAPQGVACQVATIGLYDSGNCSGPKGQLTVAGDVCAAFVTTSIDPKSVSLDAAPAAGGACLPSPLGNPVLPPLSWSERARACGDADAGGGCGPGACLPRPAAPFAEQPCVYAAGDLACPPGPWSMRVVYYQDVADTRACTSCSCGAPSGTSCNGNAKLYTDNFCSVDQVTVPSLGQCAPLPPDPTPPPPPYLSLRSVLYHGTPTAAGSCGPSGGSPTGTAIPTDPVTFCCL